MGYQQYCKTILLFVETCIHVDGSSNRLLVRFDVLGKYWAPIKRPTAIARSILSGGLVAEIYIAFVSLTRKLALDRRDLEL